MAQNILFNTNTKSKHLILEHWWVEEGEFIHHDQQIASVRDGDRIYLLRAPNEGILLEKYISNNESFDKTKPLGKIISKEEAGNIKISGKLSETERKIIDSIQKEKVIPPRKRIHIKSSPSARRKARQYNIDLEQITGTGPNGRIQLRDINAYIQEQQPTQIKTYKNKTIRYNLPLTGLARRLAQKHNLDVSKIPASPGSNRIKRKDVERYLRNPEGAVEEIEREYGIHELTNLENPIIPQTQNLPVAQAVEKEEKPKEPKVIRLSTEEPNIIPTGKEIIKLDTETILALNDIVNTLLLSEPSEGSNTVIKLSTTEENAIPSDHIIYLEAEQETLPSLLEETISGLLEEPEDKQVVIRLTTEEEESIPSDKVIELEAPEESTKENLSEEPTLLKEEKSIEKSKDKPSDLLIHELTKINSTLADDLNNLKVKVNQLQKEDLDQIPDEIEKLRDSVNNLNKRINSLESKEVSTAEFGNLSTLVNLNLIDLVKKYNPPKNEIGLFLKNYILSVIYSVYKEIKPDKTKVYYIADIKSDSISAYHSSKLEEIKEEIVDSLENRNNAKVEDNNLIVVELLAYNIDDVSGLINPENKIVLYLSYIKQFEKFFYEPTSIRSILKLSLEFDKNCMSPQEGIEFIEELRQKLEKMEVQA